MIEQTAQFHSRPTAQPVIGTSEHHAQLVKQTQKWVAQTFFGTMLRQMRQSPFKSDLFDGGKAGEAYHQMFDQHLAERMSIGAGKKLVNSIVRKIEGAAAYRKASKLPAATTGQLAGGVEAASNVFPAIDLKRGRQ